MAKKTPAADKHCRRILCGPRTSPLSDKNVLFLGFKPRPKKSVVKFSKVDSKVTLQFSIRDSDVLYRPLVA
jgi:hypothetical protein